MGEDDLGYRRECVERRKKKILMVVIVMSPLSPSIPPLPRLRLERRRLPRCSAAALKTAKC